MSIIRTDKIYDHLKVDSSHVYFRYSIDDNNVQQFVFQTGTSAPDQALVMALPEFVNPNYPTQNATTGDVIPAALIPSSGIVWVAAPATAASAGTAGQVAYDGSYFYVCTATNTWGRSTLMSW